MPHGVHEGALSVAAQPAADQRDHDQPRSYHQSLEVWLYRSDQDDIARGSHAPGVGRFARGNQDRDIQSVDSPKQGGVVAFGVSAGENEGPIERAIFSRPLGVVRLVRHDHKALQRQRELAAIVLSHAAGPDYADARSLDRAPKQPFPDARGRIEMESEQDDLPLAAAKGTKQAEQNRGAAVLHERRSPRAPAARPEPQGKAAIRHQPRQRACHRPSAEPARGCFQQRVPADVLNAVAARRALPRQLGIQPPDGREQLPEGERVQVPHLVPLRVGDGRSRWEHEDHILQ